MDLKGPYIYNNSYRVNYVKIIITLVVSIFINNQRFNFQRKFYLIIVIAWASNIDSTKLFNNYG